MSISLTITEEPEPLTPVIPQFPVRRMTVAEYEKLVADGFFGSERVEFWEGLVVDRMPHGPLASSVISLLTASLTPAVPSDHSLRVQLPIALDASEPEPDLAVVRGNARRYRRALPEGTDVVLAIEVSDSTLPDDRRHKLRMYAEAAIPEYWIVNCIDRQVEVHTKPQVSRSGPRYARRDVRSSDDSVILRISGAPLLTIAVAELFD